MKKYQNKYRISSARATFWDYGWNAAYFVTICTKNKKCWFGDITDGVMHLSAMGHIANSCWHEIPNHFPFVELGVFIIMPNHVHGIINIKKPDDGRAYVKTQNIADGNDVIVETQNIADGNVAAVETQNIADGNVAAVETQNIADGNVAAVETQNIASLRGHNQFGPQSQNLASIIRGFKIGVTKNARKIDPIFAWQPRYHDHIIRNDSSYQRISRYIIENPLNWHSDKFYNKTVK